jgi:hypothetical protein
MRKIFIISFAISIFLFLVVSINVMSIAFSADTITPEDAINYIGQQATVCGNVASVHFSSKSKGQPTFINLNRPYPHQIFTILIWGSDRSKFSSTPEKYYNNKKICVSGTIQQYKGMPEIIAKSSSQIEVKK